MAQVVATRSIHSSFLRPSSGSARDRAAKFLKPPTFASKVFAPQGKKAPKVAFRSCQINARQSAPAEVIPVSPEDDPKIEEQLLHLRGVQQLGDTSVGMWSKPTFRRKTKIVCTIGPSTNTREMIWKLAEAGMNVARLNMSHGDHASHQKVIDLVKEYNAQSKDNVIAFMLDTKKIMTPPKCNPIPYRDERMMGTLGEIASTMREQAATVNRMLQHLQEHSNRNNNNQEGGSGIRIENRYENGNGDTDRDAPAGNPQFPDLFEFQKARPPAFKGEYDPVVAEGWLRQLEKIFEVMGCSDAQKVTYVTYMLERETELWRGGVRALLEA